MTGEEKWDAMVGDIPGWSLSHLTGRPLKCHEIDAIRWAAREIKKLREIIEETRKAACENDYIKVTDALRTTTCGRKYDGP